MYGHVIPNVQLIYIYSLTLPLFRHCLFHPQKLLLMNRPTGYCHIGMDTQNWGIRNHSFPTLLRFITILIPWKTSIHKNTGHMHFEKIRRNSIWLVFLFITYNFFFLPFYTHLYKLACTHTCPWQKRPVFTCVRKKSSWFHPYYHYHYTWEEKPQAFKLH